MPTLYTHIKTSPISSYFDLLVFFLSFFPQKVTVYYKSRGIRWGILACPLRINVISLFIILPTTFYEKIGRALGKFTQLKRSKWFDNFIMLVGVQGQLFHIAAGSHPVACGSHDRLYRGQIQKLLQCCRDPYQRIPLIITIHKKQSLTYLRRTVS